MVNYNGINAVEEIQNYLNAIFPTANFKVEEGKSIVEDQKSIDVYVQQPINKGTMRTLVAELSFLEKYSKSFMYTIKAIPPKTKQFFNPKTNPKVVGVYSGVSPK